MHFSSSFIKYFYWDALNKYFSSKTYEQDLSNGTQRYGSPKSVEPFKSYNIFEENLYEYDPLPVRTLHIALLVSFYNFNTIRKLLVDWNSLFELLILMAPTNRNKKIISLKYEKPNKLINFLVWWWIWGWNHVVTLYFAWTFISILIMKYFN